MSIALHRSAIGRLPNGVLEIIGATPRPAASHALLRVHQQRRQLTVEQLDSQKNGRERVVILGSGWAGFTVARRLDPRRFQPVIVSPRSYFVFTPLLASTSVGTLEFRTALEPVRSRRMKADFLQGWAENLDLIRKKITIEEAADDPSQSLAPTEKVNMDREVSEAKRQGKLFEMSYDKLVVSVGCYSQTFGTSGVKENAYFLKDVGDARKIRKRLLDCFEIASLPTTTEDVKEHLLNFAVVGGGPTGIEFSAELHDLVTEDMAKLYPELIKYFRVTVYDVASKVLPMFDEKLGQYAMNHLRREGIHIKTSHHVQQLRPGPPSSTVSTNNELLETDSACYTLKTEEEGEIGIGMCVWSTGLMMNPFIEKQTEASHGLPHQGVDYANVDLRDTEETTWVMKRHPKTGALLTDDRLQMILQSKDHLSDSAVKQKDVPRAAMKDIYALGDCAAIENMEFPAT